MTEALSLERSATVAVIGAGAMGSGIAQVAALAGHPVVLHDARPLAAAQAVAAIGAAIRKLADKGKLPQQDVFVAIGRLRAAATLRIARKRRSSWKPLLKTPAGEARAICLTRNHRR